MRCIWRSLTTLLAEYFRKHPQYDCTTVAIIMISSKPYRTSQIFQMCARRRLRYFILTFSGGFLWGGGGVPWVSTALRPGSTRRRSAAELGAACSYISNGEPLL